MSKVIDHYIFLSSPWTYLAQARLRDLAKRAGAAINFIPMDHPQVFAAAGVKNLKDRSKQHQANRMNELRRWRARLGIELTLEPKYFPVPQDKAARLVIAAQQAGHAVDDLAFALMRACWAEERNIDDPGTLAAIAEGCGLDGKALIEQIDSAAVTDAFQANTDQAIARNVFGAPTFVYEGELFWGQDRLEFLEQAVMSG
jgi:2-hydroxychromene-2-carboxylate isomerase